MATDLQTDLSTLIGKCECAIRRGTIPEPDKLHTLQHHLVRARDASTGAQTAEQVQTAMQYYEDHLPEDVRRSDLSSLTETFDRIDGALNTAEGEAPKSESHADD